MAENTEQVQTSNADAERQIITLGETSYYADSLEGDAKGVLKDIENIQNRVNQLNFDKNVMELAIQSLADVLSTMSDTFEKVPTPEGTDGEQTNAA